MKPTIELYWITDCFMGRFYLQAQYYNKRTKTSVFGAAFPIYND